MSGTGRNYFPSRSNPWRSRPSNSNALEANEKLVIDISGDGSNNRGRSVTGARDEAVAADVVINGLPILSWEPNLDQYYKNNVIGGPGAFMIVAKNFDTFADAILKKMITEIAGGTRPNPARIGKR